MAFCGSQFCVSTFSVVACVAVLDMSLVAAGVVLMVVQITNAAGRMVAGWIADRIGSAARVMTWMAWAMLATSIGFLWLSPEWPLPLVFGMFAALGITSGAWAGILMAEAGHRAAPGKVAAVVSGTLIYVNIGKFTGPALFAAVYALTQSYNIAFALLGVPALVVIWCLRNQIRPVAVARAANG
jgi:nitrate/nitrite transporter NarK